MRSRRPAAVREVLAHDDARALVLEALALLPAEAERWLAGLALLEGLPFRHLVPDARMLPSESIRFFFVDQNWLDALLDGALSAVEVGGGLEKALLRLARPRAAVTVRAAARRRRSQLRGREASVGDGDGSKHWSGFLLRSAAVSDWPGLTVTAADGQGKPLAALRIERVAPIVLLALFDGAAAQFMIGKPAQTLHFGLESEDVVKLRGIGGAVPVGQSLSTTATATFRPRSRVLDVGALVRGVRKNLAAGYPHDQPPPPVRPAALALQLIAVAERQAFAVGKGGTA